MIVGTFRLRLGNEYTLKRLKKEVANQRGPGRLIKAAGYSGANGSSSHCHTPPGL